MTATRAAAILVVLAAGVAATAGARQGRRVVDVAKVGDVLSEHDHDYAGEDVITGVAGGKAFRQARGWMRYSLAVYEDTEVTVACTFLGSEGTRLSFDLVVEDRPVATRAFTSPSATPAIVELRVPFAITKGKTNILVMLRATRESTGPTPALLELRTIQDHLQHELPVRSPW